MPVKQMQKAVIYARYSSDKQRETSIDDQIRNCQRFAERESLSITRIYKDYALTGATSARAEYQQMLRDGEEGKFNVLLFDDLSRLSRDDVEMKLVTRRLIFKGIRVVGVSEGYDSSSKGHKIHAGVKGLMNELYLDDLRDKTHRGLTGQALKGYSCGGRTYGYRNVPIEDPGKKDSYGRPAVIAVKYEIIEDQAAVVRQIFERYAFGNTYREIASGLNRDGIPSSRGSTWALSAIKVILENEMYRGHLIWNRREWMKNPATGKRISRTRPREQWIEVEAPDLRIVPAALWDKVKKRMENNRNVHNSTYKSAPAQRYLFSGLMFCAECGGSFVVTAKNRYGCATHKDRGNSVCSNKITVSRHTVESRLLDNIRKELMSEKAFYAFKNEAERLIQQEMAKSDLKDLQKQLTSMKKQRDNIMSAIKAGIITPTTKIEMETVEARINTMEVKIEESDNLHISAILPRALDRYRETVSELEIVLPERMLAAKDLIKSLIGGKIVLHPRDGHLEAEVKNDSRAILGSVAGSRFDLSGCGGWI